MSDQTFAPKSDGTRLGSDPTGDDKKTSAVSGSSPSSCSAFPPVLDATCGSRMMWFDKHDGRAIYIDKRYGSFPVTRKSRPNAAPTVVAPDEVMDFTNLRFPDGAFDHVVFDPPHLSKIGDTSTTAKNYGKLLPDWRDLIAKGFAECFRVLRPGGTLIFKWCEFEIPLSDVLELTPEIPLYGHRTGRREKTHWVAFIKQNAHVQRSTGTKPNTVE